VRAGYGLSHAAEQDLEELLAYVSEQSGASRALKVHEKFVAAFEQLAEMPGSGSKRTELTGERVRWWPVFNWIVLYDGESVPISVLRVVHSARAIEQILDATPLAP
jgi:antitoxin ParD1/3/4/toxin ParE1/3/4